MNTESTSFLMYQINTAPLEATVIQYIFTSLIKRIALFDISENETPDEMLITDYHVITLISIK